MFIDSNILDKREQAPVIRSFMISEGQQTQKKGVCFRTRIHGQAGQACESICCNVVRAFY